MHKKALTERKSKIRRIGNKIKPQKFHRLAQEPPHPCLALIKATKKPSALCGSTYKNHGRVVL